MYNKYISIYVELDKAVNAFVELNQLLLILKGLSDI